MVQGYILESGWAWVNLGQSGQEVLLVGQSSQGLVREKSEADGGIQKEVNQPLARGPALPGLVTTFSFKPQ